MKGITVSVVSRKGRPLVLRARRGQETIAERTARTRSRLQAYRLAAQWAEELNGRPDDLPWEQFCQIYEAERLVTKSASHQGRFRTCCWSLAQFDPPSMLSDITETYLARWIVWMRHGSLAEATIVGYLKDLRSAVRWAERRKLIVRAPRFDLPKVPDKSKGRPLTDEEFERLVRACKRPFLRRVVKGLWASGLRLGELLGLSWDVSACTRVQGVDTEEPVVVFAAEAHKARKKMEIPCPPEFAERLRRVEYLDRRGPVYRVPRGMSTQVVGKLIAAAGKAAGIVVGVYDNRHLWECQLCGWLRRKEPPGVPVCPACGKAAVAKHKQVKYASAQDLRRTFGTRWAGSLTGPELQAVMRHQDYRTTQAFYVRFDARRLSRKMQDLAPAPKE